MPDSTVDHRAGFNLHHEPAKYHKLNRRRHSPIDDWGAHDFDTCDECDVILAPNDRGARDNGYVFPDVFTGVWLQRPASPSWLGHLQPDDVFQHLD